jgi:hypothetical protein
MERWNYVKKSEDFNRPISNGQYDEIGGDANRYADCGVQDRQFPLIGKCCSKVKDISGIVYHESCEYCTVWSSLPTGADLIVSYIFECTIHDYRKRISK